MNRRISLVVAVIFVLAVLSISAKDVFAKEYKIGYIDPVKVLNEYSKTKESEKSFEEKRKLKEAERKKMTDEITKMKEEQALLSEKAKAEKQAVIDDKIKTLQAFDRKAQGELMGEGNVMLGGIQKDIEKAVSDYAKEAGYDLVLNSRVLMYGKEDLDFTNEIIKRLNSGVAPAAPAAKKIVS